MQPNGAQAGFALTWNGTSKRWMLTYWCRDDASNLARFRFVDTHAGVDGPAVELLASAIELEMSAWLF